MLQVFQQARDARFLVIRYREQVASFNARGVDNALVENVPQPGSLRSVVRQLKESPLAVDGRPCVFERDEGGAVVLTRGDETILLKASQNSVVAAAWHSQLVSRDDFDALYKRVVQALPRLQLTTTVKIAGSQLDLFGVQTEFLELAQPMHKRQTHLLLALARTRNPYLEQILRSSDPRLLVIFVGQDDRPCAGVNSARCVFDVVRDFNDEVEFKLYKTTPRSSTSLSTQFLSKTNEYVKLNSLCHKLKLQVDTRPMFAAKELVSVFGVHLKTSFMLQKVDNFAVCTEDPLQVQSEVLEVIDKVLKVTLFFAVAGPAGNAFSRCSAEPADLQAIRMLTASQQTLWLKLDGQYLPEVRSLADAVAHIRQTNFGNVRSLCPAFASLELRRPS